MRETKDTSLVDFVIHVPVRIPKKDRDAVSKAFHEIFFGQDRLSPHVAKAVQKKADVERINAMLVEGRSEKNLKRLAKSQKIDIGQAAALFRIHVNEVTEGSPVAKLAASLKSIDGRKSLFVTIKPRRLSLGNEVDLATVVEAALGDCLTSEFPREVALELGRSGIDAQTLMNSQRPPLTRLSDEGRAALERCGLQEHQFGGITVLIDPESGHSAALNVLRRRGIDVREFTLSSVN